MDDPDDKQAEKLSLAISPHLQLYLLEGEAEVSLAPQVAQRIHKAFAQGPGPGLLHLGAVEVSTALPPDLAFFREFARRFMTALCAVPDLEEKREQVEVQKPADLEEQADAAPPMIGAEYLSGEVLSALWLALLAAVRGELAAWEGSVQAYLQRKNPLWNMVGKVCFHLVENKRDPDFPFAFMATYASRLSAQAKVQHLPLGKALETLNKSTLLTLLLPIQRAAQKSPFVKDLFDSRDIFQPQRWTPKEAYRFLTDIPAFEESGMVVRVPEYWQARRPPRPRVSVTVGQNDKARLGTEALLDFSVNITLEGETLTQKEWQEILKSSEGLALIRGRWVEVDRDKIAEALTHWKAAQQAASQGQLSFVEAMRLLAGARIAEKDGDGADPAAAEWSHVVAGDFLAEVLEGLRHPEGLGAADPGKDLRATLRPYQEVGLKWLYLLDRLGLGACLADDMGLGKTIQVLALLLLKRKQGQRPNLLVVPASLIANWQGEMQKFAPSLRSLIAHPSVIPSAELQRMSPENVMGVDLCITSYGSVHRLPWLAQTAWDLVVLDEAQAIKNPSAKQTRAVKALQSRTRLALTGTPVENRLTDLWSLFDFICPGLLGPAKVFGGFAKRLAEDAHGGYAPLRNLIRPYLLRRLKSDKRIIADLPDKTEMAAYCALSKKQAVLYQQAVDALTTQLQEVEEGMKRRGLILAFLMRFKQICNHPAQWLGDGAYDPEESGKFTRLRELCEPIRSRQEKVLVFTQFREMTAPLADFLHGVFGRPGLVLHGDTPVKQRMALVESFQQESGPPFFVLSLKAGGTGLNLTAASHVIHFDRWWNPAVESQASDRAYRIGQKKNVLIHKFVCRGTIEEKINALIEAKQGLSQEILSGGGEALLTEMKDEELMRLVSLDINSALGES